MQPLPHDTQIEKMLIGSLLVNPILKGKIQNNLSSEDFYKQEHQIIFEAISKTHPDIGSIINQIKKSQNGKAETIVNYILTLIEETGTSSGAENYANIVKELSLRRRVMIACMDLKQKAGDLTQDMTNIIADLKECVQSANDNDGSDFKTSLDLTKEIFKDIEYRKEHADHSIGILCGIPEIDDYVGGFEPKTLTYLIARPSMGKTALSLNMAENMASKDQGLVVYFSLEMGDLQIMRRRLSAMSQVPLSRIRHGNIEDSQWPWIIEACDELSSSKLIIVDKPKYKTIERLTALTHSLAIENKIACVFVDHVQLMNASRKTNTTHAEMTFISNELKALAKDLNIPVIALSQLNRKIEERSNKKPMLSDMRESGSLEQDADIVIGIFRETPEDSRMLLCGLKGRDIGVWKSEVEFERFTQKIK